MKAINPALQLVMSQSNFDVQELYTITLADGTVLRYGDYDLKKPTLVANGFPYPSTGLLFTRSKGKQAIGLQVGSMNVLVYANPLDPSSWINGIPFQQFVRGGGLDGAIMQIDRCFMQVWGDCANNGTLLWFYGRVADTVTTRTSATITIKAMTDILANTMPRDVYQPGCRNTLYDVPTCGLIKDNFAAFGNAQPGSTQNSVYIGPSGPPDGYFALGSLVFTSGANDDVVRAIKSHISGNLLLTLPLIAVPTPGDTFTAYPGCDKLLTTCQSKFNNFLNFRGEPFIPAPETATP